MCNIAYLDFISKNSNQLGTKWLAENETLLHGPTLRRGWVPRRSTRSIPSFITSFPVQRVNKVHVRLIRLKKRKKKPTNCGEWWLTYTNRTKASSDIELDRDAIHCVCVEAFAVAQSECVASRSCFISEIFNPFFFYSCSNNMDVLYVQLLPVANDQACTCLMCSLGRICSTFASNGHFWTAAWQCDNTWAPD